MQAKKLILVLFLLISSHCLQAQILKSWHGEWRGIMHLYSKGMLTDSVPVVLTVNPKSDSILTWKTSYLSAKMPMVKDYSLKVIDISKGHYVTDEGGGLLLDTYYFDEVLYSVFEVQGLLLTATYRLLGDQIVFEVTSGKSSGKVSGDVTNYSVNFLQKVKLNRQFNK